MNCYLQHETIDVMGMVKSRLRPDTGGKGGIIVWASSMLGM